MGGVASKSRSARTSSLPYMEGRSGTCRWRRRHVVAMRFACPIARLSFPLAEDSTAAKPIAVFSKKRSRRFQDGDLESEETKSFAANRAVLQRSHKLNNPKEQK